MEVKKPRFELTSIYSDGSAEEPRIVPINEMPLDTNTNRRGFLGVGLVAGAALTLFGKSNLFANSISSKNNRNKHFGDKELYAHKGSVNTLAFTPDGKILASGSGDETIKLWSLPDGKLLKTLQPNDKSVGALSISPDGKILVSGSGRLVKLWSLPEGNLLKTLEGDSSFVYALSISADGKILASGANEKAIKIWSLPDGILLKMLDGHSSTVPALSISPDGKILASGSWDKTVKLWSLPEGNLLKTIKGRSSLINTLFISPDGTVMASGTADNTINLWSFPEGKLIKKFKGHSDRVDAIFISPNGKILASGSWDYSIKLWSLPEGDLLKTFDGNKSFIQSISIIPDGKLLASGSYNGIIRLFDLEKNEFTGFLFDPASNEKEGVTYNVYDSVTGTTKTYTLPCGSPVPSGAVCTCNCVAGTYRPPTYQNSYCTCNQVCTCIPVCQAHKLLHPDKFVRVLSHEILLFMGVKEIDYMKWAADNSKAKLKAAITSLIRKIKRGLNPDYPNWPAVAECEEYLQHNDDVISVMAAQMINLQHNIRQQPVSRDTYQIVESLLAKSKEMFWKKKLEHGYK